MVLSLDERLRLRLVGGGHVHVTHTRDSDSPTDSETGNAKLPYTVSGAPHGARTAHMGQKTGIGRVKWSCPSSGAV